MAAFVDNADQVEADDLKEADRQASGYKANAGQREQYHRTGQTTRERVAHGLHVNPDGTQVERAFAVLDAEDDGSNRLRAALHGAFDVNALMQHEQFVSAFLANIPDATRKQYDAAADKVLVSSPSSVLLLVPTNIFLFVFLFVFQTPSFYLIIFSPRIQLKFFVRRRFYRKRREGESTETSSTTTQRS